MPDKLLYANFYLMNIISADVNTSFGSTAYWPKSCKIQKEQKHFTFFAVFFSRWRNVRRGNHNIRLSGWLIFTMFILSNKLFNKFSTIFCYTHKFYCTSLFFKKYMDYKMSFMNYFVQETRQIIFLHNPALISR